MKAIDLLNKLAQIIDEGSTLPFSSKVALDPDELLDMIEEVKAALPTDLNAAIAIKNDERKILTDSKRESDKILRQAERKMKELIDSDEITRSAYNKAEDILRRASEEAARIRVGSIDYAANVLKEMQEKLRDTISSVEDNKIELKELRKAAILTKVNSDDMK